jgi:hypothetical protein
MEAGGGRKDNVVENWLKNEHFLAWKMNTEKLYPVDITTGFL